jgi:hypothetical protein
VTRPDWSGVVHDRGRLERVLRVIREIAAIVALVLASILMFLLLALIGAFSQRIHDASSPDPEPGVSGCPFGDGECGG